MSRFKLRSGRNIEKRFSDVDKSIENIISQLNEKLCGLRMVFEKIECVFDDFERELSALKERIAGLEEREAKRNE